MADSIIEQTRALHEDLERLERVIVKDLKQDMRSFREKLKQGHRVRKRMDQMQESARKLIKLYEDEDRSRKDEIDALGGEDKVFSRFYDRLKEVREYHRKFPSTDTTEAEDDSEMLKEDVHVEFSGEEGGGRFLDMHQLYLIFTNAKALSKPAEPEGKPIEYTEYLNSFADFSSIPRAAKLSKQYREYLTQLLEYLKSFYGRTRPLAQTQRMLSRAEADFEAAWQAGSVAGWEDRGNSQGPSTSGSMASSSGIDLDAFDSVEELVTIGTERLKEALQTLGLKCGGTAQERAARLWLTKTTPLHQLDRKLFAKGAIVPVADLESPEALKASAQCKQVALLEHQVRKFADELKDVVSDTKGRVEKKQAQTYEEMMAELEEADGDVAGPADEDDEDNEFVYNPLKLPLGYDGKPIPYWLYKLHGLNQEFKCEICGNYSYWGRRAYEKHFKEWRHQNGMRALGIPNNKMFYEVIKIDEALELWRSIQERAKGGFKAETEEEYEDAQGNVYDKRTYDDLKRQGLL